MSDTVPKGRPMRYPYTLGAKIVQFPYKFHWTKTWAYKFYIFGILASIPIFHKIANASYSPNNVKTWDEIRRKRFSGEHH